MRLPIQRIDSYTQPVSGSVAFNVRLAVEKAIRKAVPAVETDPVFEVIADPRGTYTGVTVFVLPINVESVSAAAEKIDNELEDQGVRTLTNVRTWT